ncbi:Clp protease N-terminal domain-containing protein [Paractinoplanes rishiriensis]|uniref:Clp R domain-containing protein n=1 Tax=Paractinoplanes rishiriensis TaxID=1050105 RepID=A0A919MX71_9ACTN|nr:Clp protease N-terminal domain-containing protein [Actinoplanes rishiriensis]GIE95405.1 hypothetical protein Ari01nite_28700 [Actinoplanes rishiriensis]
MIHDQSALSHLDNLGKRAVILARRRAEESQSEGIAPEHLLLALLALRKGLAARTVANLSGSPDQVTEVRGRRPSPSHLPFTAATEEGLVRAAEQARQWGDDHIGTEHMLLGLLAATDNAAVRRLREAGVTYQAASAEIIRLRAA